MENTFCYSKPILDVLINMAKIAVILVLVRLTVMASAYSLRRPHFNQELYTQNENERAQPIKQLEGIYSGYLELYTHNNICCYLSPVC